jgi:hypothetical protein
MEALTAAHGAALQTIDTSVVRIAAKLSLITGDAGRIIADASYDL